MSVSALFLDDNIGLTISILLFWLGTLVGVAAFTMGGDSEEGVSSLVGVSVMGVALVVAGEGRVCGS